MLGVCVRRGGEGKLSIQKLINSFPLESRRLLVLSLGAAADCQLLPTLTLVAVSKSDEC